MLIVGPEKQGVCPRFQAKRLSSVHLARLADYGDIMVSSPYLVYSCISISWAHVKGNPTLYIRCPLNLRE